MTNEAYNIDCVEFMKTLPDKAFDLAVVDPPYGDASGDTQHFRPNRWDHEGGGFHARKDKPRPGADSQFVQVERERELEPLRRMVRPLQTDHLHSSCRKRERERERAGVQPIRRRRQRVRTIQA